MATSASVNTGDGTEPVTFLVTSDKGLHDNTEEYYFSADNSRRDADPLDVGDHSIEKQPSMDWVRFSE